MINMSYALKSTKRFDDDFASFSENMQNRFKESISILIKEPYSGKRLHGKLKGLLSLRVGDYRAVYSVDEANKTVILYFIGHRKNVYEK